MVKHQSEDFILMSDSFEEITSILAENAISSPSKNIE